MNRRLVALASAVLLGIALWTSASLAQVFSLDPGSGAPNTLFGPGPAPLPYPVGPPAVDVDCFSFASPIFTPDGVVFSVGPGSVGAAGSAVAAEFATGEGEQIADIYFAALASLDNDLLFDGDGSTPPGLGLTETPGPNIDGVDAFDLAAGPPPPAATPVFFSITPATAVGPYLGFGGPADVFSAPAGAPGGGYSFPGGAPAPVYAAAAVLGLVAGDNIDGLHYMEDGIAGATPGDFVYLSLAPGSPTLGAIVGASAADVLVKNPTLPGPPAISAAAETIGLDFLDNIDALSMHMPGAGVPVELSRFSID